MSLDKTRMMPGFEFEREARAAGFAQVAGVDEAGRGPLAGPLVVAAAVLPVDFHVPGIDDSKRLTEKRRELLFEALLQVEGLRFRVEVVDVQTIDRINILQATWQGMRQAVSSMEGPAVNFTLIDGTPVPDFPTPNCAIVKGDGKSQSIAVASIFAKVTRDRIMRELATEYPAYGFDRHKGYPTKMHLEILRDHGPVAAHRQSFQPVAQCAVEA